MPNDDQYRKAVQSAVEDIASKRHTKSSSQLVIEAVIEGVKLYRSYKKEEKKEKRKDKQKDHRGRRKRDGMNDNQRDGDYQRHNHAPYERTDGSRERHQRQHHNRPRGRDHEQYSDSSHSRYQCGSNEEHYKDRKRDCPVSRASRYQTPWQELKKENAQTSHPQHRDGIEASRSHHQSRAEQRHPGARTGRIGASDSPTRQQRGPDGTPFGSLPKYRSKPGMTFELGNHFINTYKHIKAEHDAGYRSKGFIQKALDEVRKKKLEAKTREERMKHDWNREGTLRNDKVRKKQPEIDERYKQRIEVYEWKPKAAEAEARGRHYRNRKDRGRMGQDGEQRWRVAGQKSSQGAPVPVIRVRSASPVGSPERTIPPSYRSRPLSRPSGPQKSQVRSKKEMCQSGATSRDHQNSQEAPIPGDYDYEDSHIEYRETHPRSNNFDDPQRHGIASSLVGNQSSIESETTSRVSSPIMSHAPPPPPPLPILRAAGNGRAARLESIQGGIEQLKVASPNEKGKSASSSAGGALYEQTEYSQEVEERERAQVEGSNVGGDAQP
ncbi:hypothetical protein COCSADRAFT_341162 [Bipolaris sorokiniana ND90Pr]|uniref:Uncharacterized protein n=1 Tax=Cochliobolus sativus (strain ND90Pr / ATCC 201652) TaxID=665912 RepID=M2SPX5_COCSN|nr:uncharacterized protein COCSADRAFT_341162 [Bipolaris sorokiniana ND90Pr]EMD69288.1 hypothetical protein COCSADRAFT_341162 [Bipolaris sorokiniana ND90Pr]